MESAVQGKYKSRGGQELWRQFLEAENNRGQSEKQDKNAYKCPWLREASAEVTKFSDMMKFKRHAVHCMLWCPAKETDKMLNKFPLKYRISMQIRYDGNLGFPGGIVSEMKDFDPTGKNIQDLLDVIKKGLIREVEEEMMLKIETDPKYIYSACLQDQLDQCQHANEDRTVRGNVMHFFCCQIPIDALEAMEKNTLGILSSDEVLGITRVPLYFMSNNRRGLPSFLVGAFVGNALEQLIRGCLTEGLLSEEEVRFAYFVASTLLPNLPK